MCRKLQVRAIDGLQMTGTPVVSRVSPELILEIEPINITTTNLEWHI